MAIGSVHVDVVPSTRNFVNDMRRDLLDQADKIGRDLGDSIGRNLGRDLGRRIAENIQEDLRDGIEQGLNSGIDRATRNAGRRGRDLGRTVGQTFGDELKRTLDGIDTNVDLKLRTNSGKARTEFAAVLTELNALKNIEITPDLDARQVFGKIAALQARLAAIRNLPMNVELRSNIEKIDAQLRTFVEEWERHEVDLRMDLDLAQARREAGAFAADIEAIIGGAIKALPEIQLDADASPAERRLAALRAELEMWREFNIDVDIDSADALAGLNSLLTEMQTQLAAAPDIEIHTDIARSIAKVEELVAYIEARRAEMNVDIDAEGAARHIDQFTAAFRKKMKALEAATHIDIDVDGGAALATLDLVNARAAALKDVHVGVDMDAGAAVAEATALLALLNTIDTTEADAQITAQTARAKAAIEEFVDYANRQEAKVRINSDADLGPTLAKIRAQITAATDSLPKIPIEADDQTRPTIEAIRARLAGFSARINVNTNKIEVLAEIASIEAAVRALPRSTRLRFDTDLAQMLGELAAARAAMAGLGDGADDVGGRMQRWRLILGLVVALLPLIAGALLAISAAAASVVTVVGAIALGWDGVKKAVEPLMDDFGDMKVAVSDVFEKGLKPAVEDVAVLIPKLTTGFEGSALALSKMATGVTDVVTQSKNLDTIGDSFDQINAAIEVSIPTIQTFTQNVIDIVNLGAPALGVFGQLLNEVALDWQSMISKISDTGVAQEAIQGLFQVISSLIGLITPLTELGAVLGATLGPALSVVIDVVAVIPAIIADVVNAFSALNPVLGDVAAGMVAVGLAFAVFGKFSILTTTAGMVALTTNFANLRAAIMLLPLAFTEAGAAATAFSLAGRALLGTLLAITRVFIPLAIIGGIIWLLSALGDAQAKDAEAAQQHAAAVQGLASALRDSGGAITDKMKQQTAEKLLTDESTAAIEKYNSINKDSQVSVGGLTNAITSQGPAYDALIQKLKDQVAAADAVSLASVHNDEAAYASVLAIKEQGRAAADLLGIIGPLGDEYRDAAALNRLLAQATQDQNLSMSLGVVNTGHLNDALKILGDAAQTTADKVTALKAALDALDGGQRTAEQAAANLNEAIRSMGDAFKEAADATKGHVASLIDVTGQIDTTSEAGGKLFKAVNDTRDAMLESATAAFDHAGGLNNVGVASQAAATEVDKARQSLIDQATQFGLTGEQAAALADHYLEIPSEVTTLLTAQGISQIQRDLTAVTNLMQAIPPEVPIKVVGVTQQAQQLLENLGAQVKVLDGTTGTVEILANEQVRPVIQGVLDYIKGLRADIPLGADGKALPAEVQAAIQLIKGSGPANIPTGLDTSQVPPQVNNVATQVTGQNPQMPTSLDTSQVPGQAAAAAGQVTGQNPQMPVGTDNSQVPAGAAAARGVVESIPAQLTILPGSLEFIQVAISNIRTSVATPLNFSIGIYDNASAAIAAIHTAAAAPVTFELTVIDAASQAIGGIKAAAAGPVTFEFGVIDAASQAIGGIKSYAAEPVTMPINADTGPAQGALDSIVGTVNGTTATMHVNAEDGGARGILNGIVSAINGTTAIMHVNAEDGGARGILNGIVSAVNGTTGIMHVNAEDGGARGILDGALAAINGATGIMHINAEDSQGRRVIGDLVIAANTAVGTVLIKADARQAEATLNNLTRPRSVTITANVVGGGNAIGNIVTNLQNNAPNVNRPLRGSGSTPGGSTKFFADGGMAKRATTGYAKIFPPNSIRVIGDRARGDEAYIPINQAPRSHSLLGITANRMGYNLVPMAEGGLLTAAKSLLRLAQVARGQVSTQTTGLFTRAESQLRAAESGSPLSGGASGGSVEKKFDQLISAVESQGSDGPNITINDTSGDPVQVARAAIVQMRLRSRR